MSKQHLLTTIAIGALMVSAPINAVHADDTVENANVENLKWDGRINFGGFLTDGNTSKKSIVLDGLTKARDDKNRYTLGAEIRYAKDEGTKTEDRYMAYAEYDRFINEKLYAGARLSYESDDIADLDSRIKVGPYVGYQYFESEELNLSTRLGLDFIATEFESGDKEENAAISWGVDYDQKVVEDTLQIFYKHDVSLPVDDTEAFLYNGEAGVRFPIAKILTGSAQVDFDWNNSPADGVQEDDTTYSLKLGYEF